jgi:hypothetical protein
LQENSRRDVNGNLWLPKRELIPPNRELSGTPGGPEDRPSMAEHDSNKIEKNISAPAKMRAAFFG